MKNLVQDILLLRIGKDQGPQFFPMEGPILFKDLFPKYFFQFIPSRCVGLNQLPSDLVGINDIGALFSPYFRNGCLSTGNTSRQSNNKHSFEGLLNIKMLDKEGILFNEAASLFHFITH